VLTSIEIDGVLYHAQQEYDDDLECYLEVTPVLDENGSFMPIEACLCNAYTPSECCCATTAWDNYSYDDFDYD
jgi:hypothetical protein